MHLTVHIFNFIHKKRGDFLFMGPTVIDIKKYNNGCHKKKVWQRMHFQINCN
jgi:hypothetical protein